MHTRVNTSNPAPVSVSNRAPTSLRRTQSRVAPICEAARTIGTESGTTIRGTSVVVAMLAAIVLPIMLCVLVLALVRFIPVIGAMGGNVGGQSSTIVVRGFATGRVDFHNLGRFLVKEPERVEDLKLSLRYRGGAIVYLNGEEIARQHLPRGNVGPKTLAIVPLRIG